MKKLLKSFALFSFLALIQLQVYGGTINNYLGDDCNDGGEYCISHDQPYDDYPADPGDGNDGSDQGGGIGYDDTGSVGPGCGDGGGSSNDDGGCGWGSDDGGGGDSPLF